MFLFILMNRVVILVYYILRFMFTSDYLRKQEELKRMEEIHQQEMQRRLGQR